MPNHIINRVTIEGPKEQRDALLEAYTTEGTWPDFEKVLPTSDEAKASHNTPGLRPRWYVEQNDLWGTKWNAYERSVDEDGARRFETAWNSPHPVFVAMSKAFPELALNVTFADEDTGYNCGRRTYQAGRVTSENLPAGGSREAYELAFELRPHCRAYYALVDGRFVDAESVEEECQS